MIIEWTFFARCYDSGATNEYLLEVAFLKGWFTLIWPNISGKRGHPPPPTICARSLGQWMPYNFAVESFHTKKLCGRLSSRKAHFWIRKTVTLRFEPPWELVGQRVNLMLIGKLVVDFLVVIELFSLGAFVLSQCTRNAFDRRTDRQRDRRLYDHQTALHTMQRGKKLLHTCTYYQTLNTVSKQSHVNVESGQETPISKVVHELKTVFHRQQKCIRL